MKLKEKKMGLYEEKERINMDRGGGGLFVSFNRKVKLGLILKNSEGIGWSFGCGGFNLGKKGVEI